jgi:hypothetical protein
MEPEFTDFSYWKPNIPQISINIPDEDDGSSDNESSEEDDSPVVSAVPEIKN